MEPDRDPEVYKREIEVRSPEEDISEALRSEAAGPNRVGSSEDVSGLGQGPDCLLYTSPSPRDGLLSRMPSSA